MDRFYEFFWRELAKVQGSSDSILIELGLAKVCTFEVALLVYLCNLLCCKNYSCIMRH